MSTGLAAFAAPVVPAVPRVRADKLSLLENSSHRRDTIAYRIEQFDELERQMAAERLRDGIPPSDTANRMAFNLEPEPSA